MSSRPSSPVSLPPSAPTLSPPPAGVRLLTEMRGSDEAGATLDVEHLLAAAEAGRVVLPGGQSVALVGRGVRPASWLVNGHLLLAAIDSRHDCGNRYRFVPVRERAPGVLVVDAAAYWLALTDLEERLAEDDPSAPRLVR